ncbi:hypothetical protein LTS17_001098 [Exophiala oligosperma]
MGVMSNTSENVITHPREVVYDYATNPTTWGQNYKGSGGMVAEHQMHKDLPLKVGYTWTEKVTLPPNTYHSTWTLITAVRPFKWVIQQTNGIGKLPDGTGGVDGITTITYTFEEAGPGQYDLLTVMARPGGIDRYHANIQKQLDNLAGK